MSTYNREKLLPRAIDSILNQSYTNFELLLCDDCSSDNSIKIINNYIEKNNNIKLIKNEKNIGLTKSLNKLLKIAMGDYIARCDSDDYYHKDKLEKQIHFLQNNRDIHFVGTWGQTIDYDGNFISNNYIDKAVPAGTKNTVKHIMLSLNNNCIIAGSPLYKKEVFNKIGLYDEIMYSSQDFNLHLRMLQFFNYDCIQEKLYYYCQDSENRNHSIQRSQEALKFYRKYGPREDLAKKRAIENTIIK
tara:strand:+ start:41 stop:775 length:735 start_codon:yes stop_codon:yes gene_type:complete